MQQYTYTPLPDPGSYIRLLTINSIDEETQHIQCSLETYPLDDLPPYHAVSYAWGTAPFSSTLQIGDESIAITKHLHEGIRCMHVGVTRQRLWIDAICINQPDHLEKAAQIPLMGIIYRRAAQVLVWLGPTTDEAEEAMGAMTNVYHRLRAAPSGHSLTRATDKSYARFPDKRLLNGLSDLLHSSWFDRLWTLQEVVLPSFVAVVSGPKSVELELLLKVIMELERTGADQEFERPLRRRRTGRNVMSEVRRLWRLRAEYHLGDDEFLVCILEMTRDKDVTLPVDRVYAILGLIDRGIAHQVLLDCSERTATDFYEVYLSFGRALLQSMPWITLSMADTREKSTRLPSWCPDWTAAIHCYHFGMDSGGHDAFGYYALFRETDGNPLFEGFEDSRIADLIPLDSIVTYRPSQTFRECEDLVQQKTITKSVSFSRLARTLMAGRCLESGDDETEEAYKQWRTSASKAPEHQGNKTSMYDAAGDQEEEINKARFISDPVFDKTRGTKSWVGHSYALTMGVAWANRCFFVTDNGSIGIASDHCQVGDVVCVLTGAQIPYILRVRLEKILLSL